MLPAWDIASADRAAFRLRGKIHGNYCGWGHTSPPDTPPVDEVDAACRAHDMRYSHADEAHPTGTLPWWAARAAADRVFGRRLTAWRDRWGRGAPRALNRAVDAMQFAVGTGESILTAPTELADWTPPPHPLEEGGAYAPALEPTSMPADAYFADRIAEAEEAWIEFERDNLTLCEAEDAFAGE